MNMELVLFTVQQEQNKNHKSLTNRVTTPQRKQWMKYLTKQVLYLSKGLKQWMKYLTNQVLYLPKAEDGIPN